MKTIEDLLKDHDFFRGMDPQQLAFVAGCGKNERFEAGQYLAHESDAADSFFVIRHGRMAVETFVPGRGPVTLQTMKDGDVVGWSWIFPPYKWVFDVHVLDRTTLITLDGACLRKKCDGDPRLGYELMKRFAFIMTQRIQATRMQLLDVYGDAPQA